MRKQPGNSQGRARTCLKWPAPISHLRSSRLLSVFVRRNLATHLAGSQ